MPPTGSLSAHSLQGGGGLRARPSQAGAWEKEGSSCLRAGSSGPLATHRKIRKAQDLPGDCSQHANPEHIPTPEALGHADDSEEAHSLRSSQPRHKPGRCHTGLNKDD